MVHATPVPTHAVSCWEDYNRRSERLNPDCPQCRGRGRELARFRFVSPDMMVGEPPSTPHVVIDPTATPPVPPPTTPPATPAHHYMGTPASVHTNFGTPQTDWDSTASTAPVGELPEVPDFPMGLYPWWPVGDDFPAPYFHASTSLPDGRLAILVDPGAWTNLAGGKWARAMAEKALRAGHTPSQSRMSRPISVQGVGEGTQRAVWETTVPIAGPHADNDSVAGLYKFEAPTVDGSGADLPALLGLRSMSSHSGVLEMAEGKEMLTFPGPGGYKIEWSPGTTHFKLEKAPSGHLVMPCDTFDRVQPTRGGVQDGQMMLYTAEPANTAPNTEPTTVESPPEPEPVAPAHTLNTDSVEASDPSVAASGTSDPSVAVPSTVSFNV